jgi:hypothetical protein
MTNLTIKQQNINTTQKDSSNDLNELKTLINGIKTENKVDLIASQLNKEVELTKEKLLKQEKEKLLSFIDKEKEELRTLEEKKEKSIYSFEEWQKFSKEEQEKLDNLEKELNGQIQELKNKINAKHFVISNLKLDIKQIENEIKKNKVIQDLVKSNKEIFEKYFKPIDECQELVQNEALEECKIYAENQVYSTREHKKHIYKELFTKAYKAKASLHEIKEKLRVFRKSDIEEIEFKKCLDF